jgi:hypothetical protein
MLYRKKNLEKVRIRPYKLIYETCEYMAGTDEEVKGLYLSERPTNLYRCAVIGLLRPYNIFYNVRV